VNKDCAQILSEIGDVRAATDEVARSKVIKYIFSPDKLSLSGFGREVLS
jgi:hypothetical protein